jgi:hypothetical protein
MTERRTPADILDMTPREAESYMISSGIDAADFVETYEQLESTMPLQCKHCPHLVAFAALVASHEISFEEACEIRQDSLQPSECGGAELKVLDYYGEDGELDGIMQYICLSRAPR